MIRKIILAAVSLFSFAGAFAQNGDTGDLPVEILPAQPDEHTPLVVLITGDGGWKDFTPKLAAQFVHQHVPVVALNALRYFWTPKTPGETTNAIDGLLNKYMQQWHKKQFILVGFSFGADVLPFVVNRLPAGIRSNCLGIALFSPGRTSDFEIHLSQMLGSRREWKYNVAGEIEKMQPVKALFFFGTEEQGFPADRLTRQNWEVVRLPGGHHYENTHRNLAELVLEKLGSQG